LRPRFASLLLPVLLTAALLGVTVPTGAATGTDWDTYAPVKGGTLTINKPGTYDLSIRPRDAATWRAINMTSVRLERIRP